MGSWFLRLLEKLIVRLVPKSRALSSHQWGEDVVFYVALPASVDEIFLIIQFIPLCEFWNSCFSSD